MSQPVKLSDNLVLDARITSKIADRSIAGQIEHWARLGRAIEPFIRGDRALALKKASADKSLSECLGNINTEQGRKKLDEYLASEPFPHYEPTDESGLFIQIQEDGTRTVGRFVNREFKSKE